MDIENFKKNLLEALRDKSFASKVRDLFLDECTEFDIDVFFTEDELDAIAKRVFGKLKGDSRRTCRRSHSAYLVGIPSRHITILTTLKFVIKETQGKGRGR